MPRLIGNIQINPSKIFPGESIQIEVFDPQKISYASKKYRQQSSTQVSINDVHGAKQYLQFAKVGNYPIQVKVLRLVKGKPQQQTKTLDLKVKNPARSLGSKVVQSRALASPDYSGTLLGFSSSVEHSYKARFYVDSAPQLSPPIVKTQVRKAALTSQPVYRWKLDKGVTIDTQEPALEYDFESLLDSQTNQPYQNFHVELSIKTPGSKRFTKTATRTLTVYNPYALSKHRGYIVPRIFNPYLANNVDGGYEAVVGIENLEDQPLLITHLRIQALGVPDFSQPITLESPILIQARMAHAISFVIDPNDLPQNTSGFTLFLGGNRQEKAKGAGMPVRIEAYFEVAATRATTQAKVNIGARAVKTVKPIVKSSQLGPAGILLAEMMPSQKLKNQALSRLKKRIKKGTLSAFQPALSEMIQKLVPSRGEKSPVSKSSQRSPAAGSLCDPREDGIASGMVCQLQPEQMYEVEVPGRFVNAQKGDILLSLGGDGVIAHLLRQVSPPQFYDHSGLVTQDMTLSTKDGRHSYSPQQISHSTATIDRWLEHLEPHFEGLKLKQISIKEDILKYSWPGLITQDTDKAIYGEKVADPQNPQKEYDIHSFDPASRWVYDPKGQAWVLIPPMIVKPDPMLETAAIRQLLHKVADEARTQKSHYRLSVYTDASIDTTSAPPSTSWESDSWPSVCSSYIWSLLRKLGVHFEGNLDPDEAGKTDRGELDGLYYYTTQEREVAAKNLHNTAFMLAKQMAEQQADFRVLAKLGLADIDDIARKLANQIVNTFTKDDASAKGAKTLLPIGDGHAVSPADVMFWDGIDKGGVYGYHVAAKYRPKHSRQIPVYRWTAYSQTGSLSGKVTYKNKPVEKARVKLFKGKETQTSANGSFRLEGIPVGWHQLEVIKQSDSGLVLRAAQEVEIVTTENPISVVLSSQGRLLVVKDALTTLNGKQPDKKSPVQDNVQLSSINPHEEIIKIGQWVQPALRLEIHINVDWQENHALSVLTTAKVYSEASEVSTLIGQANTLVKAGQKETITFSHRPQSGQLLSISLRLENKEALA